MLSKHLNLLFIKLLVRRQHGPKPSPKGQCYRLHGISVKRNPLISLLPPNPPTLCPLFVSLIQQKQSPGDHFLFTSVHGKGQLFTLTFVSYCQSG